MAQTSKLKDPSIQKALSTPTSLWIGLDWADKNHFLACYPADGSAKFTKELSQKPKELEAYFFELHQKYPHISVCVEQSRGPLIYALMKFDFITIYPINPRCLSDYRRSFKVSGAKSDPTDADLLADMGCKHNDRLRVLLPQDPITRSLALLGEHRRDLVQERTSHLNRLSSTLKAYYPLALELFGESLDASMAAAFLRRWPNLAAVKKAKPQTLRQFFYAHNSRSEKLITARLNAVASARPLSEDPALLKPMQRLALTTVQLIRSLNQSIAGYDKEMAVVFAQHANAALFKALPGAGPVLAPRLAAAFGTRHDAWASAQDMLSLSGVAPVLRQSGKQRTAHFRWVRPKFLHQTFVEFAKCSIGQCPWAALLYKHLLEKGKSRWMAIRIIAFKWIRILWCCWKDNTPYDEARYLRGLQKRQITLYQPLYAELPVDVRTTCE
jgi:transposase